MIYQMEYFVQVSGLNKTEDDLYVFNFRITENGIVYKQSLNSVADELSIFIPKKNSLRYKTLLASDDYSIFGDFESNFVKRGDKVYLSFGYDEYETTQHLGYDKYTELQYIVNEVIIGENEIELKCMNHMYFLNSSSFFEITNKKINISTLSEKIVELVNNKIDIYNKKISKITSLKKINTEYYSDNYQFTKLNIITQPDLDINITLSSNKINLTEILKLLSEKYFINTRIVAVTSETEDYKRGGLFLMMGGEWIKLLYEKKELKGDFERYSTFFQDYFNKKTFEESGGTVLPILLAQKLMKNEIFFSDIPQNILISKLGVEKARNYHKIIERDDFVMQNAKDVRLKIIAKVHNRENKTTTIVADNSDVDGNIVSYNFYEPSSSVDVTKYKKLLDNELSKLKYDGFKQGSSFTMFGFPIIRPNDIITLDGIGSIRANHLPEQDIKDPTIFARKGSYLVETVETTFDKDGWRQRVSISVKIPNLDNSSIIDTIYPDYTEILLKGNDEQYIIQEAYQKQQDALKKMDRVNTNKKLR